MKKFISFLLISTFSVFLFAQEKIEISVPSFDKDGKIVEEVYERDIPTTYEESVKLIKTLTEIYEEVNNNYKNQILEYEKYTNKIQEDLDLAKKDNKRLKELLSEKDNIDKYTSDTKNSTIFKDNFESIGILFDYSTSWSSNNFGLQIGFKFWKFTFTFGPELYVPVNRDTNNRITVGLETGLGFWF